jgi:hypothetical protein
VVEGWRVSNEPDVDGRCLHDDAVGPEEAALTFGGICVDSLAEVVVCKPGLIHELSRLMGDECCVCLPQIFSRIAAH